MNLSVEELAAWNIIKNRRRQLIYRIPNTLTGYHINEKNVRVINLYQNRLMMFAMLFALAFSILRIQLILLIPAIIVVYFIIDLLFKKWYLPRLPILKIREEETAIFDSAKVLKAVMSQRFLDIMMSSVFVLIFVLSILERPELTQSPIDLFSLIFCITISAIYALYSLYRYWDLRKRWKIAAANEENI